MAIVYTFADLQRPKGMQARRREADGYFHTTSQSQGPTATQRKILITHLFRAATDNHKEMKFT